MAEFRFYAELNEFLAPPRRGVATALACPPHSSVKHAIETLGVPHTEVGLVLREGRPCGLEEHSLQPAERISVYPAWRSLRSPGLPGEAPRFIADAHLGRLARWLRFAGLDTLWHVSGPDHELAALALRDKRVVLTRDRALLMHRNVERGCFLRPTEPLQQLQELAFRLDLPLLDLDRPARCTVCNAVPRLASLAEVLAQVPERTRGAFDRFWRCPGCERVYWHGSHWQRMRAALERVNDAWKRTRG